MCAGNMATVDSDESIDERRLRARITALTLAVTQGGFPVTTDAPARECALAEVYEEWLLREPTFTFPLRMTDVGGDQG